MRRKALLLTLSCLSVLLLSAARAAACSCIGPEQPCQAFGSAAAVFVGTVTGSETRQPKEGEDVWGRRVFKFAVLQPFLGVEGTEVEVATGMGGGDCGYGFRKGETYLVYAYGGRDGKPLATGICSRTTPVSDASEDLEFLRALPSRAAGVTISFTVTRYRQRVAAGDREEVGGLAGARLVVEGGGEQREVKTDSAGRAQLSGLKPGGYKVSLELPEKLTTHRAEQEVTVSDRGCAEVFYQVSDNGRLGGRVSDADGRGGAGVLVALVEGADPEPERHYSLLERTDDEGRYNFKGVPPGRYLIAVNLNRYPQPNDPTNAYPRTFYPGVAQQSQAEVVSLGAGEAVKDRDFTLPPRRAECSIKGTVVWDDGRPVADANVSYRDVTYHDPGMENGARADQQGRFQLKCYQGQTLIIRAASNRKFVGDYRRDGPMEAAEPVRVTAAGPSEAVRIVIKKLR